MSELITVHPSRVGVRWQLLATASAVVMAASFPSFVAIAGEESRPTVWIEGGWHFDDMTGANDPFVPPLDGETHAIGFPTVAALQKTLAKAYGAEGRISLQPSHTDWVFSLSALYGRAQTARNIHQEKAITGPRLKKYFPSGVGNILYTPVFDAYVQQKANNSESHTILDFQVGKDLGIGLLGRGTDSVISFGARYAQFNYRSKVDAHAAPFASFVQASTPGFVVHPKYFIGTRYHKSASYVERHSNLHMLGPSIFINSTTGLIGQEDGGQLVIEWSANAAVLFGKQRVHVSHHVTGFTALPITTAPFDDVRSRNIVVPNLGGAAALSYHFPNAKLSVGYRADFFFGATDNGLDVRDSETTGFHGPFATVSVGLGG